MVGVASSMRRQICSVVVMTDEMGMGMGYKHCPVVLFANFRKLKLPALPLPLSHFVSDSVVALTSFVIGTHCSLTGLMPFSLPQ
ncbi:hypothetical protein V6N13_102274 [Hibiscus sabdariffa]